MKAELETNSFRRGMINAVLEHYELLIESYEINSKIKGQFSGAAACTEDLLTTLQATKQTVEVLTQSGAAWRKESHLCRHAAATHSNLGEIAKAPELLKEAVHQEMYTEVLDILRYIQRLTTNSSKVGSDGVARKGSSNKNTDDEVEEDNGAELRDEGSEEEGGRIALLDAIRVQTTLALEHCLEHTVLPRLCRLPLSVESVFRVVQFLRLLSPNAPSHFFEVLFLGCRHRYIQHLMEEARTEYPQPLQRARRYLQIYRGPMSEVVLQFKACFVRASSGSYSSSRLSCAQKDENKSSLNRNPPPEQRELEESLLSQWCCTRGEELQDALENELQQMSNSYEMGQLWDEAYAACLSSAKTQFSLWPVVSALIVNRVITLFSQRTFHARQLYQESMKTFSWKPSSSTINSSIKNAYTHLFSIGSRAAASVTALNRSSSHVPGSPPFSPHLLNGPNSAVGSNTGSIADLIPPAALMEFPPLALALNEFINAANVIHRLILPGLSSYCVRDVVELVRYIGADLARDADVMIGVSEESKKQFFAVLYAFEILFFPHVCQCMLRLFGEAAAQDLERGVLPTLQLLYSLKATESQALNGAFGSTSPESMRNSSSPDMKSISFASMTKPTKPPV